MYPDCWLTTLTIFLCKPGKTAYHVAKSYQPIGLLETLGKYLSTLVAADLTYLMEKYQLHPPMQFGGRARRCITDVMHLVTQKIKDAWRRKKMASILFLDIQPAFPNTVKERLLHNMKSRRVPSAYVNLFECMLSNHKTQIRFNDYTSEPININNGTMQGCPLSMILYTYYNADLIDLARGKNELSTGFVDDCMFVAIGDTLKDMHQTLQNMMEHSNSGLEWSWSHNSPFEISKLAVMDFPRPNTTNNSPPLLIQSYDHNGSPTTNTVTKVQVYKYLEVTFDPKLKWGVHIANVIARSM